MGQHNAGPMRCCTEFRNIESAAAQVDDPRELLRGGTQRHRVCFPSPLYAALPPAKVADSTGWRPAHIVAGPVQSPKNSLTRGLQFPPLPPHGKGQDQMQLQHHLSVWLQTLHHAQAPTPIPPARRPTGRPPPNTWPELEQVAGVAQVLGQLEPRHDTDIANEPVGLVGSQFIRIAAT